MSNIYVNTIGNGTAYVDNPTPVDGDIITIYAYADPGASLLDLVMDDQGGAAIAISVTAVQQLQYDGNWGDCTITATFSHDTIIVNSNGFGYAYVSNPNPSDGESVTLECIPNNHYEVTAIDAYDEWGNQIPMIVDIQQTFIYDANWGTLTIDVYFDKKFIYKNLWILFRKQWWRKNNY
ncbi:MAG: hypothetical protein IKL53_07455 [Lachnospiraceae bacterium]|nr:hypothetical protein [Lachnospiraceae bacterium]